MGKKIRVVHILYHYYKSDARVKAYCNYLKKSNFNVTVLDCDYFSIRKVQGKNFLSLLLHYFLFFIKSFIYLIKNRDVKIIHIHNLPNFLVFSGIINKWLFGAKLILDNHDIMPLTFREKSSNKLIEKLTFFEQNISMKVASKVFCADDNQKTFLISCGIPEIKITTILNVANSDIFKKMNTVRNDNEFRLIYHGTISKRLGIDLILRAIKAASLKADNIKFHLIGEGDYLNEVKDLITELSLENNIVLKDSYVPVEHLPDIISQMDAGIIGNRNTSISDYMLPVKLLEYVYMERPVIAPRNKIISRYFSENMICFYEPGNFEEMSDKILYLYKNREARKSFSSNALKFTEQFNYETEMKKYDTIISRLLN